MRGFSLVLHLCLFHVIEIIGVVDVADASFQLPFPRLVNQV